MSVFSALSQKSKPSGPPGDQGPVPTESERRIDALLARGRGALLLDRNRREDLDEKTLALAWLALEKEMAFVPAPDLGNPDPDAQDGAGGSPLRSFYLDRFAVTNADFARFVENDGYSQTEYWPQTIWPNLLQFVDSTGHSGPRFWSHGEVPKGKERHPVVGVNWFEARAYAKWCGKRLPTSTEWQHAASWCGGRDGRTHQSRYPWGDTFVPNRANTWTGGPGRTVAVDEFAAGCTPNGVYQLVGNVWEWVATQFEYIPKESGLKVAFEEPMVEIRGGAFDTYFETQATCHFRTGQPFMYRGQNVGFRCCVPASQLTDPPPPSAFRGS